MAQYGNIELAMPGLFAEGIENKKSIKSRVVQDTNGIEFGAPAMGYVGDEEECYPIILDTAKIFLDSDFASGDIVNFTVNGATTGNVTFATSHDNTMDLCIAAITALTGVDASLATTAEDANNRTIYVRTKGSTNTTTMADAGGTPPAETITVETDQVFLGIAGYTAKNLSTANTAKYEQYEDVNMLEYGTVYALSTGTIQALQALYISVTAGATLGRQTATAGVSVNTKAKSDNKSVAVITTDTITKIEVKGQYKPYAERVWV
jgi:hypothetical protein